MGDRVRAKEFSVAVRWCGKQGWTKTHRTNTVERAACGTPIRLAYWNGITHSTQPLGDMCKRCWPKGNPYV